MILLGLAGKAGSGKDTVADYLVRAYGFVKFSFSDTLYEEVQTAFDLEDQALLRDRATKDTPQGALSLENCENPEFVRVVWDILDQSDGICLPYKTKPLSPRQVLQWWGTEYRRAQDPDYWIRAATRWLHRVRTAPIYPEHRPQLFVNTSVRFVNECNWIHDQGGNVWRIRRDGLVEVNDHISETPLGVRPIERELWNNDTIERLHRGIDLLLTTSAKFVRVEPMVMGGSFLNEHGN